MKQVHWIFTVFMIGGCVQHGTGIDSPPNFHGPRARVPPYGWAFYNSTPTELENVEMKWSDGRGELTAPAGNLLPDVDAQDDLGWAPIPEVGTVYWNARGGPPQQQVVHINSIIPDEKHFTGKIWLIFESGHWRVAPFSAAEADEHARKHQPNHPD